GRGLVLGGGLRHHGRRGGGQDDQGGKDRGNGFHERFPPGMWGRHCTAVPAPDAAKQQFQCRKPHHSARVQVRNAAGRSAGRYLIPVSSTCRSTQGMSLIRKGLVFVAAAALAALAGPALAALPKSSAVPGGVVVVDLGDAASPAPAAKFQGRPVLVTQEAGRHKAVVGIALSVEPGDYTLEVTDAGGARRSLPVKVAPKKYREQ